MLHRHKNSLSGFTLVELAIVLGVAGILFGGLWRLMSSGNTQMRDQATANQQAQLISAVSSYLQSPGVLTSPMGGGIEFLKAIAASGKQSLTLPTAAAPAGSAGCAAAIPANPGLCNFLPPGFNTNTTNPYGQFFNVSVLKDATAAGTAPQSYSFMILTSNGDTIADTSGGRISAMIGGDGGFVYTANVCGAPASNACGAYGAWSTTIATYFAAAATTGHIASRTYYTPLQNVSDKWLARVSMPGDPTFDYNTMRTPLYLGGQTTNFGSFSTPTGGTMNMQGGTIFTQTGTINATNGTVNLGTNGLISGTAGAAGATFITLSTPGTGATNPVINIQNTGCVSPTSPTTVAACNYTVVINGGMSVSGLLYANNLFAGQFVYYSSDERLKTNIVGLSHSLADIMKLRPVSFTYKANGKQSTGLIAQEVEKVYPALVTDGPTGYKAVGYDGLISPLIGAVQELKQENDALKAQLREQDLRQEKLEQALDKLLPKEGTAR